MEKFNLSTTLMDNNTVKATLTELGEYAENSTGRAEQGIINQFETIGVGNNIEKAEDNAFKAVKTLATKLKKNYKNIRVQITKDKPTQTGHAVTVGIGIFEDIPTELVGKGPAPILMRVEATAEAENIKKATNKAIRRALSKLNG